MYFKALVPFKFCHIGEPLLIWPEGMELAVKKVFRKMLRTLCLPRASMAVVFDSGLYILYPTDAKDPFIVDMDAMVMPQVVVDPAVAFVGTFQMDFLNLSGKLFVLGSPAAQLTGSPLVIGRASHMKQRASDLDGASYVHIAIFNSCVDMALSYLREASLLSTSSNFFSRVFSICARYSLCLSCSISICARSSSVRGV